ncbi:alpha/beta fold hydrolase [Cryptosporangium arvum]|uniref:alpha/beta fold hydrolase n=1 Tax=Cryptosporangium arvum TaxID=80871 RepID=UPI0004B78C70|nr:alpha/beta fold hydrolase [Cryptosporangium arvum]
MTQLAPHRAEPVVFPACAEFDGNRSDVVGRDAAPAGRRRGTALFVPGYTGSKEDFAPLFDPLTEAGYRVVAIDQPGQFESPGPGSVPGYTVEWLGDVVRAVAAALGDDRPHLVGHSFGGLVARAAVLAAPAEFRSLTLLGSGPGAIAGARRDRMERLASLLPLGMDAVFDAMDRAARLDPGWRELDPELQSFLKQRFVASSAAGLQGMGDALRTEPDRTAELRETGVPVLVCHGRDDDAWLPPVQADMAERLGARYEVVPDAAHSPAIENPAATAAALTAFWVHTETR